MRRPAISIARYREMLLGRVSEDEVQCAIVGWLETLPPPPLGPYWTAVNPVPGKKSKAAAARLKRLGLRAGAPDIFILWHGRFGGAECKRPKGGRLGKTQPATHAEIIAAGGVVGVVRSLSEFVTWLIETWPEGRAEVWPSVPRVFPWWEKPA